MSRRDAPVEWGDDPPTDWALLGRITLFVLVWAVLVNLAAWIVQ